MIMGDLLLSTLPNDRMYEFNLNWILSEIKKLKDDYYTHINDTIDDILAKTLIKTTLHYEAETLSLRGVDSIE